MLADPRAESLSTRFAAQWLRLNDVAAMLPDAVAYPYYDRTLGDAFVRETELFFQSLVAEDRPVLDLLTADYSYVNERIARHYGIPNVSGPDFRRVALPRVAPRRARTGQHPGADLGRRPHLAGDARQVDHGSAARLAAAAPAAERAGARSDQQHRGRQGALDARADGRAPQEPGLPVVSQGDRSARPGARQLRRHRQVADQGQRRGRSTPPA